MAATVRPADLLQLTRQLPMEDRLELFRETISMAQWVASLDRKTCFQLLAISASRFSTESLRVPSPLGNFEGSPRDKVIMASYCVNGTWAPGLQSMLLKLFPGSAGTFLDIGANIGLTCIPIAVTRNIQCHVFEPAPENYRLLCRNIDANDASALVHSYPYALFSKNGVMHFELSDANRGDHRLRDENAKNTVSDCFLEGDRNVIEVKTVCLDEVLDVDTLAHPIVVKIDTQGAEVHVLDGAQRFLEKVDVIICEVSPYHLARMGHSVEMLLERLSGFAYAKLSQFDELIHVGKDGVALPGFGDFESVRNRILEIAQDASPDNYFDVIVSRQPCTVLADS